MDREVAQNAESVSLWEMAAEIDTTLKGGSIALPATSDRERRIYRHGVAVGIRTALLELGFAPNDRDDWHCTDLCDHAAGQYQCEQIDGSG